MTDPPTDSPLTVVMLPSTSMSLPHVTSACTDSKPNTSTALCVESAPPIATLSPTDIHESVIAAPESENEDPNTAPLQVRSSLRLAAPSLLSPATDIVMRTVSSATSAS